MESTNSKTLETLSQCFLNSLSPDPRHRHLAESSLSDAADLPGFALDVLHLASSPTTTDQIRNSAVIHFKNHLRSHWSIIPEAEKDQIKSLIVPLMFNSNQFVRMYLGDSLSIISSHDFPRSWPSLLPDLVSSLRFAASTNNIPAINCLLDAATSIFNKFPESNVSPTLLFELNYCLDNFAAPLLEVFLNTSLLITLSGSPDTLHDLFQCQIHCCDIFYSLNSIELPQTFKDHMCYWMTEFHTYLTTAYPSPIEEDGTAGDLRFYICRNLQLYMEKYEGEFKDYLPDFASAVWNLLISPVVEWDDFTISGIRFLTTIVTGVHHALFAGSDVLQKILERIVLPNVRFSDEDEELFELYCAEYIHRDLEGGDEDTRRRTASELLKGIFSNYEEKMRVMVATEMQSMLERYDLNPRENWREKDCVIYLMIALATKDGGNCTTIVDVQGFFTSVVVPELQMHDVNAVPVLKADALRFFVVFRESIPKHTSIALLPDVIRLLASKSIVVHSYAANCIEKLLLVTGRSQSQVPGSYAVFSRFDASDIDPYLSSLMTNLFNALQFPESQENHYVMKSIMRVLGVADTTQEFAATCISHLASLLKGVCKNPKDPIFNHFLCEAIAALTGRSCEKDQSLVPVFERNLFPVLQSILVNNITEFWSYAFEIFAQLVETNRPPLSGYYMELFQFILSPDTWKRSASAPALLWLLRAYLWKVPNELKSEGRMSQVLRIFSKLTLDSDTEDLSFYVLNTIIENPGYAIIAPYIRHIWNVIFGRLQNECTEKFVNSLVIFMSLVLVKQGISVLVDSVNAVQQNLFGDILRQLWIPSLKMISGPNELKLSSVASTLLICESLVLLDPLASDLWGKMLDGIISMLARQNDYSSEFESDWKSLDYSASFDRLQSAWRKEDDPLKEISDPKEFLVMSLAKLSAASPGRYPGVIQKYVDPSNQASLLRLCGAYNLTII